MFAFNESWHVIVSSISSSKILTSLTSDVETDLGVDVNTTRKICPLQPNHTDQRNFLDDALMRNQQYFPFLVYISPGKEKIVFYNHLSILARGHEVGLKMVSRALRLVIKSKSNQAK